MRIGLIAGCVAFHSALGLSGAAKAETITFEASGAAGAVPNGFTAATTGRGSSADWKLQEASGAPSGKMVVGQLSTKGPNMRFPVLVYDAITASNTDVSVKFKAISGSDDQAAGIVVRYQDANNYYVVRANALEDNVVFYIVKNGSRIDLPIKGQGRTYGAKAPVTKGGWNTLGLSAEGNTFKISLNGKQLYEVEDKQIPKSGKIGLWTKADSVMQFDDLVIGDVK
jgi:Domain of Unknown Function (DUF1080)